MRKWFSPFGDDEPEPPKKAPAKPLPMKAAKVDGRQMTITDQVRTYLLTEVMSQESSHAFCQRMGYPKSSLSHILTGTGMHMHSLERLAKSLGWSVEIRDSDGKTVAEL